MSVSTCSLIGTSATRTFQVWIWPLEGFCCPLNVTYSMKKDSPSSQSGDAVGRSCWQPQGRRTALSLSACGMCWPPCRTAVTAPWPTMDTEQQTTRMEACFLFACCHVACPPQLREERQIPGRRLETERSVSPPDYSPWPEITGRIRRKERLGWSTVPVGGAGSIKGDTKSSGKGNNYARKVGSKKSRCVSLDDMPCSEKELQTGFFYAEGYCRSDFQELWNL